MQALDQHLINRIHSLVLCISEMCDAVVATSIVWDYTRDHVLLLTNNHLGCARVQVLLSPKSGRKLSREEDLCWESVEDFVVIQPP